MCYKEFRNLLAGLSSVVSNGSSSRIHLLPTRPRRLWSGCGGMFRPLSTPRIGPRGVQTSTPWTTWRDPSWKQRQRSLWRRCVRWQQSGLSVSRLASGQRAAILSDIIINKNLKLLLIKYFARKVDVLFHFPSRPQNPCNRTYGKTLYINDWSNEPCPNL